MTAPARIAIVGSGIAGLSAAWLLGRRHAVTLFERHARPGMGAFNLDFNDGQARIDVPLRVFKSDYYDNLMALYRAAGVAMQPTDHAAAYTSTTDGSTYFRYRNLRAGRLSVPVVTSGGRRARAILRDTLGFMRSARRDAAQGRLGERTIGEYLHAEGYGSDFVDGLLLPTFAAICTCSYDAVRCYPAEVIVDFFNSGSLLASTWRARHGADDAIARLLQPVDRLHCNAEVLGVRQHEGHASLSLRDGSEQRFDHVVLAVQANQAAAMLDGGDAALPALLRRVPYESSEVVVHSDTRLIPDGGNGAQPVSYVVDPQQTRPMASICLNRIIPALAEAAPVFQTWNPLQVPHAARVLGEAHFERPLVTLDSQRAMRALVQRHDEAGRRLWCCGSYVMPGIPLLESAVQSAMAIAERLDTPAPWGPRRS